MYSIISVLGKCKAFSSRSQLEVKLGDAEVQSGKGSGFGSGLHLVVGQEGEMEVLAVHGSGGQHGALHPATEPVGSTFDVGKCLDGLAGVLLALVQTVADGDDGDIHLVALHSYIVILGESAAYPAGIQPQGLSQEDKAFTLVAEVLLQQGGLVAHHGNVVRRPAET